MQLILHDSIFIRAPKDRIIAYIMDPLDWPRFHPRVVEVSANSSHSFEGIIRFKGKEHIFAGALEQGTFQFNVQMNGQPHRFSVTYTLESKKDGYILKERVHYYTEIPFLVWLITKFISLFGKKAEPSSLGKLKELCES